MTIGGQPRVELNKFDNEPWPQHVGDQAGNTFMCIMRTIQV